jgi:hypothetical protein
LTLSVFAVTACDNGGTGIRFGRDDKFEIVGDVVITMDKGACYGKCPVFKLTLKGDGSVSFDGGEYTSGKHEGKVDPAAVEVLINDANAVNFLGLDDVYSQDTCPNSATDSSTVVSTIRAGGRSKTISHYRGCTSKPNGTEGFPPGLTEFEEKIINTSGIRKWFT